jgi:hypothetical protein
MAEYEKASHDGSLPQPLDERRRAALAEIDNAPFSYVYTVLRIQPRLILVLSKVVPRQSLLRSRHWFLHRCVSPLFYFVSDESHFFQL